MFLEIACVYLFKLKVLTTILFSKRQPEEKSQLFLNSGSLHFEQCKETSVSILLNEKMWRLILLLVLYSVQAFGKN